MAKQYPIKVYDPAPRTSWWTDKGREAFKAAMPSSWGRFGDLLGGSFTFDPPEHRTVKPWTPPEGKRR